MHVNAVLMLLVLHSFDAKEINLVTFECLGLGRTLREPLFDTTP
jgi:hypothetical protein